jgi:hypothetical protein
MSLMCVESGQGHIGFTAKLYPARQTFLAAPPPSRQRGLPQSLNHPLAKALSKECNQLLVSSS